MVETKCDFCSFFGEKQHCHNCKIINRTSSDMPREIECSLDELIEYINTHEDITEQFHVGDYKDIELVTGEVVRMYLFDANKDKLADGSGKARSTFGIVNIDGVLQMNKTADNRCGWKNSSARLIYLPRIKALLPETIKNNMKYVSKSTFIHEEEGSAKIDASIDDLFLLSECEIHEGSHYSIGDDGEQYDVFSNNLLTITKDVLLRSPYRGNHSSFLYYSKINKTTSYSNATSNYSIAFCFCI